MTTAIYAGSFDPITKGHMDVIFQTIKMFGWCNIFIAINPDKKPLCDFHLRQHLILEAFKDQGEDRISVIECDGLVIDKAKELYNKDVLLIRGVRNVTDMISELALADVNEELSGIKTVFIPTSNEYRNYSSSLVKELWKNGMDISKYVPHIVMEMFNESERSNKNLRTKS